MSAPDADALLPCPFCGGEAQLEVLGGPKSAHRTVRCCKCKCDLHFYSTREMAIDRWNTRTAEARISDLEAQLRQAEQVIADKSSEHDETVKTLIATEAQLRQEREAVARIKAIDAEQDAILSGVGPIVCRNGSTHELMAPMHDCMYCVIEQLQAQVAKLVKERDEWKAALVSELEKSRAETTALTTCSAPSRKLPSDDCPTMYNCPRCNAECHMLQGCTACGWATCPAPEEEKA